MVGDRHPGVLLPVPAALHHPQPDLHHAGIPRAALRPPGPLALRPAHLVPQYIRRFRRCAVQRLAGLPIAVPRVAVVVDRHALGRHGRLVHHVGRPAGGDLYGSGPGHRADAGRAHDIDRRLQPGRRVACGHERRRTGGDLADPSGRRSRGAVARTAARNSAARILLLVHQPIDRAAHAVGQEHRSRTLGRAVRGIAQAAGAVPDRVAGNLRPAAIPEIAAPRPRLSELDSATCCRPGSWVWWSRDSSRRPWCRSPRCSIPHRP